MSNLTVTGVDLGSSSVKIAAVLKGGVQIITNQANFRQTPNVIGFLQSQRLIGEQGQVKIKSNHSNTVIAPSRYLGFNKESDSKYLQQQLKSSPCRSTYANPSQKQLKFIIPSTKDSFYPQQIVASYIGQIQKIISQTNNLQNKHMTISIPSYFSQHQRKALLNAIQISNKKINKGYKTQLIDEQIAISMDYGFSRRNQFHEQWPKSKNVLFIDFGHSKTNIFVTAFNKNHMRVLANKYNRQLGCKSLDQQLLKFYAQKFDNSHNNMDLNLLQSKKATLKLLDAVQRQRKILSGINQHELNIQCLLQEQDFNYTMKREQYQQICSMKINQFKSMLINFAQQLKDKSINFDLIELIGGGTRIPIILKTINQVFNIQPSRTINSSQCIAKGAALISAMNSAIFKVHQYAYFNVNSYPVDLKVNGNVLGKRLVEKNQLVIKEKLYEFQIDIKSNDEKTILEAEYQKQLIQNGLEKLIFRAQINLKYSKQNQMQDQSSQNPNNIFKLILKISIDENGLYQFNNIIAQDKNISLTVSKINTFQKFTSLQLQQMQQKQKQMTLRDLQIKKFYQKKNQFQGFIYKSRQRLSNFIQQNKEYVSQVQIKQIQDHLDQQQKYLYEHGQQMINSQQFHKKSLIINQKIDKLFIHVNHIKQAHLRFNTQLSKLMNYINEIITKRPQNMYPQQVNKVGQWVNSIIQQQKSQPKYNLPVVKVQQIQNVLQNLSDQLKQFDNQMQRQRMNSQRGHRSPYQQYPRRPETGYYQPYEEPNYYHTQHQQPYRNPYQHGVYEPRTTRNTKNKNNSSTFGSGFFGSGFPSFF